MRTKEVKIDNATFVIGALVFDQVDSYLSPLPEPEDPVQKAKAYEDRAIEMICAGLNNGATNGNGDSGSSWTPKRFLAECDHIEFQKLHDAILLFSGLGVQEQKSGGDPAPQ